jgi:hypothetical protein
MSSLSQTITISSFELKRLQTIAKTLDLKTFKFEGVTTLRDGNYLVSWIITNDEEIKKFNVTDGMKYHEIKPWGFWKKLFYKLFKNKGV